MSTNQRYTDFLENVLGEEVASKTSKNVALRMALARFPFVKHLETSDFSYQPSTNKNRFMSSPPAPSSSIATTSWS